ncbi:hypothetical protein EJB05_10272, partial [Eragrostis curvula]
MDPSMSNKRRLDEDQRQRRRSDKRPQRRKHLYLALDDWDKDFSIHKIHADTFDSDTDDDDLPMSRLLREPPVLHLESPAGDLAYSAMSFSALGTNIFAFMNQRCPLRYDTGTAALAVGPHPPAEMVCCFTTYVPAGDTLYALSFHPLEKEHYFFAMSWGPTAPDVLHNPTEGWSWKTLPPPAFTSRVAAYALHPDGCTIFVTADHESRMRTFSFNIKDSVWTCLGDWALPFHDQGHFDSELDAWIGLRFDGSICACPVVSPTATPPPMKQPDWKMTDEKLVCAYSEGFMTATLAYMGNSRFCLVQSRARDGQDGCVLHVTVFGVKYNRNGELQTSDHRSTRSFLVSRHRINHFRPAVFWM